MNITTNLDGGKLTLTAEGKIGSTTAPELDKAVMDNIGGVTELVFDFEKVEYMASAGLRVLLSAAKIMKNQGKMKIINVPPAVMEVLSFTGMADVMDVVPL